LKKQTLNTTESISARPITEPEIDKQFGDIARQLETYEKETIIIPDNGRPGEEIVELGYNGRMFLIKRGEPVTLPTPLAQVLRDANMV